MIPDSIAELRPVASPAEYAAPRLASAEESVAESTTEASVTLTVAAG